MKGDGSIEEGEGECCYQGRVGQAMGYWTRYCLPDAQDNDFVRYSIFCPPCREEVSYFMASPGISYDVTSCVC
jgi:hypothetical protein